MNKANRICGKKQYLHGQNGYQEATQKRNRSNPSCEEMMLCLPSCTAFSKVNAAAQGLPNNVGSGRGSSTRLPTICFFFSRNHFLKPLRIEIKTDRRATKRETIFDNAHQQIDGTCQLLHAD
jgi:hypothetical protein